MMAYDLRGGAGLRGGSGRPGALRDTGEVEPMASVANIVDAMLVLSVGLMVAIIAFWNVDTSKIQEVLQQDEITEVEDVKDMAEDMTSSGSSYTELGTVYQDPATGQLYMLTEDVDKGASNVLQSNDGSSSGSK